MWYGKHIKSHTKLIPALKTFPDHIIVTADDDIYYPKDWLEKLYKSYLEDPKKIHAHRIHRVSFDKSGHIRPYGKWEYESQTQSITFNNFLTGTGGVLYPPHVLHKDILNEDFFLSLSLYADDVWFWAMSVLNDVPTMRVKDNVTIFPPVEGTQNEDALFNIHVAKGANDNNVQLGVIFEHYPEIFKKLDKTFNYKPKSRIMERLFSIKNKDDYRVLRILGLKIKWRSKDKNSQYVMGGVTQLPRYSFAFQLGEAA
jgi:hypothetical protein